MWVGRERWRACRAWDVGVRMPWVDGAAEVDPAPEPDANAVGSVMSVLGDELELLFKVATRGRKEAMIANVSAIVCATSGQLVSFLLKPRHQNKNKME
jgi:hypothetical protein